MKSSSALIPIFVVLFIFSCANDETLEQKAARIHSNVISLDSHTDTPLRLIREEFDIGVRHDYGRRGGRLDFPRMKEGGLDAAFFAVFTGQGSRDPETNQKVKEKALSIFDHINLAMKKYPDQAGIALTAADAELLKKAGKLAIYLGMENGYPVGEDLSLIKMYYDLGARYITLCHTSNNDICDSSTDDDGPEHGGLSEFGEQVVAEMNRLGMLIDISHISDEAVEDVLNLSKSPVIASHSCVRALCDNPRNLNDKLLTQLADKNGVIQICLMSDYLRKIEQDSQRVAMTKELRGEYRRYSKMSEEERQDMWVRWEEVNQKYPAKLATVSDLVDHIDHVVKVAGIDHVGIGSDFDGGGALADCQDVSQMGNITLGLVRRGYSEEQIGKIWSGNFLRVLSEAETLVNKNR